MPWLLLVALFRLFTRAPAAAVGTEELLSNADFADGLREWKVECEPSQCGSVATAGAGSGSGSYAVLHGSPDEWTVVAARQLVPVQALQPGCAALGLTAMVRSGEGSDELAAAEVTLKVGFEHLVPSPPPCAAGHAIPPAAGGWKRVELRCPLPSTSTGWRTAYADVGVASVRSTTELHVDAASLKCVAAGGEGDGAEPQGVPPVVHFIFGLSPDFGGKPFGLVHHLVIKAAIHAAAPQTTYFHHAYEPRGQWWDATKPLVTLRRVRTPDHVFGRTLRKFAHQADVLRLELLQQFGGLYLDLDVMLLRPMAPLLTHELVLGQEGIGGSIGLGNALMVARRTAPFLRAWYAEYRNFSDAVWNGFSVRLPSQIALRSDSPSVHVLDYAAFYWPPWNPWGIAQLYRTPTCLLPNAYAVHLWETKVWKTLLSTLSTAQVTAADTCFTRIASAILSDSFDFSSAIIGASERAAEGVTVVSSRPLLSQIGDFSAYGAPEPLAELPACLDVAGNLCRTWADAGECSKNPAFMRAQCARSCSVC